MKGLFITVEGVDGSGKSLLIDYLVDILKNAHFNVERTREPGGTPFANRIRSLLLDFSEEDVTPMTEMLLFTASRAQHVETFIKPALAEGKVIISDRYADTMFAYQGAGRNLEESTKKIHDVLMKQLDFAGPHLTIFLDVSLEISNQRCLERGCDDRMDAEANKMKKAIIDEYRNIAKNNRSRVATINANHDFSTVLSNVVGLLEQFLNRYYEKELPRITLGMPPNIPGYYV